MAFAIELSDEQWDLIADLFDPPGRRGAPARIPRREMVDAMLLLCRTGCQRRYLPERYAGWGAVWQQWRRWRATGVWQLAMARLASLVRIEHGREPSPSMVVIDAQTVNPNWKLSTPSSIPAAPGMAGRCSGRVPSHDPVVEAHGSKAPDLRRLSTSSARSYPGCSRERRLR